MLGPEPCDASTAQTITRLDALKREPAEVRQAGMAFDREELNLDIPCIAAPVRDRAGEVIAALGVQRLTRQLAGQEGAVLRIVREIADETSQRLGWRPRLKRIAGGPNHAPLID